MRRYVLLLMLIASFITACTMMKGPSGQKVDTGSIIARVQWPDDLSDDLVSVRMSVLASDMKTVFKDFRFKGEKEKIYGIHEVAAGDNRAVILEGLNSNGQILFEGSLSDAFVETGQINDLGLIVMKAVSGGRLLEVKADAEAGDRKVTLRWRNVAGADSYNIYMNGSPGASKKNFDARKATSSTSYDWKGLRNGTTYYFVVTAENRDEESNESMEVSSTPQKPTTVKEAPGAPKNVNTKAGNGRVTISWDGVGEADSYNIYMNGVPGVSKKNFDARKNTASTSYDWAGLRNKTTYYFIVTTENRYGESGGSNEVKSTPKGAVKRDKVVEEEARKAAVPARKAAVARPAPPPRPVAPAAAPERPATLISSKEALQKADEIRAPKKSFTVDIKMTSKKGEKETSNEVTLRVKDFNKSLVIYRYPPLQKGRVLLMVESNMWIYFPGTKRSIRISPQQQMLGQVSNADVARVVFNLDYEAESVEEEVIENEKHIKMSLKAKTKGAAYGSIKVYIKKKGFKLTKAEFFTPTGRLLKMIYYKGYKNILGKERPTVHEIHDAISKSEISIMEYSNWRVEETPDKYFQKTFMQRVGGLLQ